MRKFKHKLFDITLEEIPNTGMSVLYRAIYGGIPSNDQVCAFFVHGSNLFIQTEGEPIKEMQYEKYPVGTKIQSINTDFVYEKRSDGWYYNKPCSSIEKIHISEDKIGITFKVIEEKPIIFTTEDGVDIREGDKFWMVLEPDWSTRIHSKIARENSIKNTRETVKYFSTESKAEEYLFINSKSLSIDDVIKALIGANKIYITAHAIKSDLSKYLKNKIQ